MNVQINVPMLGRLYEFDLDAEMRLSLLIEEIAEVICQREHCQIKENTAELLLFHSRRKKLLSTEQNLIQAGIRTGDILILI